MAGVHSWSVSVVERKVVAVRDGVGGAGAGQAREERFRGWVQVVYP